MTGRAGTSDAENDGRSVAAFRHFATMFASTLTEKPQILSAQPRRRRILLAMPLDPNAPIGSPTEIPDPLAMLLRAWNFENDALTLSGRNELLRTAEQELGLSHDRPVFQGNTITILAREIQPYLPRNGRGETMADVFGQLRLSIIREMGVPENAVRWDGVWGPFDGEFLSDLLTESKCDLHDPNEMVGETVRCIWKARGGQPFWEAAPYEENWCASQGIFYDLRQLLQLSPTVDRGLIEPATPLEGLVPKKGHGAFLLCIESRFGVWLGARPKEGCLPVLIAGVLASPLSLFLAACILIGSGIKCSSAIPFAIYGLCIATAALIYIRSQPRLAERITTVKDLVRCIVQKRREAGVRKGRIRPVLVKRDKLNSM